jgi:hypothetical protein
LTKQSVQQLTEHLEQLHGMHTKSYVGVNASRQSPSNFPVDRKMGSLLVVDGDLTARLAKRKVIRLHVKTSE